MSTSILTDLLMSLGLLGMFLIIGFVLRAKIKFLQNTFIPASVIGGTLLFLLGPQVLNILPVPEEWFHYYSLLPGILIVPVVTATPLGLKLNQSDQKNVRSFLKNVIPLTCIGIVIFLLQFAIGYGINLLMSNYYDFYEVFGIELAIGFVGGHGTAGTLGNLLSNMNLSYWQTSQGIATTTATFGLVGGILIGIFLINFASRRNYTAILERTGDIPQSLKIGYEKDTLKQSSTGKETTLSSSIDVFGFHAAIIFVGCLLAYLLLNVIKQFNIPVLSDISIWAYGMIIMFMIWGILCKLKLDYLVDAKVKGHITGSFTEFAVIAAIASMPIESITVYIVPILIMVFVGYLVTTFVLWFLCKNLLRGYWFEQMIGTLGMSTGVFLTGILLLRICDPDFKTPALASYSLSYSITSVVYFIMLNIFILMPIRIGVGLTSLIAFILAMVFIVVAFISNKIFLKK